MNAIDIGAIVSIALLGSVGHCIGMCGGFITSYSSVKIYEKTPKLTQAYYHSLYNSGRITTYAFIGTLFGLFGQLWEVTPYSRATFFAIIAIFMILMSLSILGFFSSMSLKFNLTNLKIFRFIFGKLLNSKNPFSFFGLGALNGFFPCGQVYFFAAAAASTGSIIWGSLTMLVFGISTIPVLWSFGFFVGLFNQGSFRSVMLKISAVVIGLYGFWIGYKAYEILNYETNVNLEQAVCH